MLPFRKLVLVILGLAVVSSVVTWLVLPPVLTPVKPYFVATKLVIVLGYIFFAWTAHYDKVRLRRLKEEAGTLWSGDYSQVKGNLSERHFEAIRHHIGGDEELLLVTRRYWYFLRWAIVCFITSLACAMIAIGLAAIYPEVHFTITHSPFGPLLPIRKPTHVRFSIWGVLWILVLVALVAFYVGLRRWQQWKWQAIRVITDKNLYLIWEQPTFMPWMESDFQIIEWELLTPAKTRSRPGQEALMRYGTLHLEKYVVSLGRAEPITLDHVDRYYEFYRLILDLTAAHRGGRAFLANQSTQDSRTTSLPPRSHRTSGKRRRKATN